LRDKIAEILGFLLIHKGFNIPAKGFSTHSESSSFGGEEFGITESSR
jgi:hypothetical protein